MNASFHLGRALAAGALALLVGACGGFAVTHPKQPPLDPFGQPPATYAQVCVVRPAHIGAPLVFPVRDNGTLVGATRGPSYFCYLAGVGHHSITVEGAEPGEVRLTAQPVRRYFIEHEIAGNRRRLVAIDESRARQILRDCDYAMIEAVPEGEAKPPAVPSVPGTGQATEGVSTTPLPPGL
ncbi:MAG: hypothetical protein HY744_07845 [Deltaproteobacteria bacterium]|nr:hypothetical protein [Deltaproteobacteria bacterium]